MPQQCNKNPSKWSKTWTKDNGLRRSKDSHINVPLNI